MRTIYLLNDKWLSWGVNVDVARGIVPGDNTYRIYLTAPSLYSQPRWTNYALPDHRIRTLPGDHAAVGRAEPRRRPDADGGRRHHRDHVLGRHHRQR